jgi:hypothetical protein
MQPTIVCAWCHRIMVEGTPLVSHGICELCSEQYRRTVESRFEGSNFSSGGERTQFS